MCKGVGSYTENIATRMWLNRCVHQPGWGLGGSMSRSVYYARTGRSSFFEKVAEPSSDLAGIDRMLAGELMPRLFHPTGDDYSAITLCLFRMTSLQKSDGKDEVASCGTIECEHPDTWASTGGASTYNEIQKAICLNRVASVSVRRLLSSNTGRFLMVGASFTSVC